MTKDDALQFLRHHQPLPDDPSLTLDLINKYDQIRQYFLQNSTSECVPLFLNSFGNGGGLGVYQLIEDVIRKFPAQEVIPHLATSLNSRYRGVRYWSAQISALFPSTTLIEPLALLAQSGDLDIQYAAVSALERIVDPQTEQVLRRTLDQETNSELRELIEEVLKGRNDASDR